MQHVRRIQLGGCLGLAGIALACVQLALPALGYELGPIWGYTLLILAILFGVGALIAFFWPWIEGLWAKLRRNAEFQQLNVALREASQERDELRQENEELIAGTEILTKKLEMKPDVPATLEEWLKTTPLITIANQTYRNDRIELDGFFYDRCVFEDCTFSFKGTKPFRFSAECGARGGVNIEARSPQAQVMLVFLKQIGALHPNTQWWDFHDGKLIED